MANGPTTASTAATGAAPAASAKQTAKADRAAFKQFHAEEGARGVRLLLNSTWSRGIAFLESLGYGIDTARAIMRAAGATDLEPAGAHG